MRDLIRARATAVRVLGKARQHLQGFLLRHGRVYAGKKGWTLPYRRWLTTIRFDHPAQQVVLQDYIHSVHDAEERIARLTKQIEDLVPTWSMAPVVEAFQAMRGVTFVAAVTVVAEVGDFTRFDNPRQVMAYLGLTPSEHSSGTAIRRGGITQAGNALARRVLIEGAWTDRPRHHLESAGQARRPLSSARSDGQAQGRRDNRDRAGDGRLSLGDCAPSAGRFHRLILRR
jgi:transposase